MVFKKKITPKIILSLVQASERLIIRRERGERFHETDFSSVLSPHAAAWELRTRGKHLPFDNDNDDDDDDAACAPRGGRESSE